MKLNIFTPLVEGIGPNLSKSIDRHRLIRIVSVGGTGDSETRTECVVDFEAVKRLIASHIKKNFADINGLCPIRIEWE